MKAWCKTTLATLFFVFSISASANNGLVLETLFQQGVKFISAESLTGQSASAFSTYRMMMGTDSSHPKSKAFGNLLERAVKNKVASLSRSDVLKAEKLKLDYLSLQYEVGVTPSAWVMEESSAPAPVNAPAQATPVRAKPVATAKKLSAKQERIIYSNAKIYVKRKQLFSPSDKNAMRNVLRLLASNPNSEKAISLYFRVFEEARNLVESLIEDGEYAQAESLARAGLDLMPENYELQRLMDLAEGHRIVQEHIAEIHDPNEYVAKLKSGTRNRMISNGRTYMQRKEFFAPEGANAYGKFRRVLQSDPNNKKVQGYIQKLATEVTEFSIELAEEGQLNQAIDLLDQGLDRIPEMSEWTALKHELIDKSNIQATRIEYAQKNYSTSLSRKSVRALIANIKVYLRDGSYFGNGNNNANTALYRILATEPDNKKVVDYELQLVDKIMKTAIKLTESADHGSANQLIESALQHFPEHPQLLRLQGHLLSLTSI